MTSPAKVSVLRNTLINYAGQAYALLIGILIQPMYLGHLGAETYGLIGFFAVLQTWLQLLDVGISASLVRDVAHGRGQIGAGRTRGQLLRSLEFIFIPLATLAFVAIELNSEWMAGHWLNVQGLSTETVAHCIGLMGLMIAFRLLSTLYKSGVQGVELHGWLNLVNVLIATVRYFGGLILVMWISQEPLDFFVFQAFVAVFEMLVYALKAYRLLPNPTWWSGFDWQRVKPIVPFALSMSFTSILWIALTQLDKLVLSKALPLAEYGYFSLVALISTGIVTLTNPLVQALLPRMTVLVSQDKPLELERLYRNAARFAFAILLPLAAMVAFHGEALIFAWTGDKVSAHWSEPILFWYALGSALLALSQFQFYLQYAYGKLRLHVWYSLVSAAISVPIVILVVLHYGAYGAALAWFFMRLIPFVIWPMIVHGRFAPNLQRYWNQDLLVAVVVTAIGVGLSKLLYQEIQPQERFAILATLALSGGLTLVLMALSYVLCSPKQTRSRLFSQLYKAGI
ncbi:oligosaccharide flippase family protein [Pseudomonas sp. MS15a(2019)]|uniref:lipopolysaccharide biosynthesis protein n=1 Tax=Pseudomonas sp. MS15a(2019) TaxID=2579938 RepID=UPI001564B219|nr:oligosaccharide flippase family protein [Pseudomonas sp. MS15a(2019)]NRH42424.1 polysaccharide biosynthesis protein [Pseudomonas sp. MS15a(2019)]